MHLSVHPDRSDSLPLLQAEALGASCSFCTHLNAEPFLIWGTTALMGFPSFPFLCPLPSRSSHCASCPAALVKSSRLGPKDAAGGPGPAELPGLHSDLSLILLRRSNTMKSLRGAGWAPAPARAQRWSAGTPRKAPITDGRSSTNHSTTSSPVTRVRAVPAPGGFAWQQILVLMVCSSCPVYQQQPPASQSYGYKEPAAPASTQRSAPSAAGVSEGSSGSLPAHTVR